MRALEDIKKNLAKRGYKLQHLRPFRYEKGAAQTLTKTLDIVDSQN